jgi:hypothetical protein
MHSSICLEYRFALHRDERETVHNFEGTVLACIVAAFEEHPEELSFEVNFSVCLVQYRRADSLLLPLFLLLQ